MRASAVACSLALFLAACGKELLTAPPEAVAVDTVARVQSTKSSVIASARKRSTACPLVIVDGSVITQIDGVGICEADIASIEIVKGAAAALLYGSGCQHGSISVVTKVKTRDAAR